MVIAKKEIKILALLLAFSLIFSLETAKAEIPKGEGSTGEQAEQTFEGGSTPATDAENKLYNDYISKFGWKENFNFEWPEQARSPIGYEKGTSNPKAGLQQFEFLKKKEYFYFAEARIEKSVPGYLENYTIRIIVVPEQDERGAYKDEIAGGFITIEFDSHYGYLLLPEYNQIYYPLSVKESKIEADMAKVYQKISKKAYNDLALLDYPGGTRISEMTWLSSGARPETLPKIASDYFAKYGWDKYLRQFDFLYVFEFFNENKPEAKLIDEATKKSGIKTDSSIETQSEYYYSEHTFRVEKGSKDLFFLDFCFSEPRGEGDDLGPRYAWIVAKPAKKNAEGTLDRFIYPVNASMKEIRRDMKAYFEKGK